MWQLIRPFHCCNARDLFLMFHSNPLGMHSTSASVAHHSLDANALRAAMQQQQQQHAMSQVANSSNPMTLTMNLHALGPSMDDEYMHSPNALGAAAMADRMHTPKKAMLSMSPVCNFEAFSHHFHLPLKAAAEKFGVRATAFKKRCRAIGIRHWPYRKVRSLKRSLQELNRSQDQGQLNEKQQYQYATFKKQLEKLMSPQTYGIDPSGRLVQQHFDDDDDSSCDDDSYASSAQNSPRYGFSDCSISPADNEKTFGDFSTPSHLRSIRKQQTLSMNAPFATELPAMRLGSREAAMSAYVNAKFPYGNTYEHYAHEPQTDNKPVIMRPHHVDEAEGDHPSSGCALDNSHHDFMPTEMKYEEVRSLNEADDEFNDHSNHMDYSSERFFDDVFLQISPDYGCLV